MEKNYYSQKLNSEKLYQVYQTKIPRIQQYFDAEISYVRNGLNGNEKVLELGAGYGRIMIQLAPYCKSIVGIDISENNVLFGKEYLKDTKNAQIKVVDVHKLEFKEKFDVILCLQNGLSAMKVEPNTFVKKALEMLNNGGRAYFSTYSSNFWDYRLQWFQEQANKGLLGEIDLEKTKNGVIVCKDGFTATTHSKEYLENLGKSTGYSYNVEEVNNSSVFLLVTKN